MQTLPSDVATVVGAVTPNQPAAGLRRRVLVAEDAECVQRCASAIVGEMNMEVETAADGRIACHMVKTAKAEGRPYDLILMDMQMPNMDGVETTQWLRRNHWSGPIVAVSVHVGERNRAQFFAAGCDDFVAKPLTRKKLRAMLMRLARRYDGIAGMLVAPGETVSADQQKPGFRGRLLVAEDARCAQLALGLLLRKMNLDADMTDNGRTACEMAMQSQADGHPYDLILMDVQMPKMNGKQAMNWLRDNGWQGPIVAVSVHATDRDHDDFLRAGCDDYLAKPVTESSLQDILSMYLTPA
jgi:two-component system, sensor histidine kinase and response regulator